jgi:hypothetical protein
MDADDALCGFPVKGKLMKKPTKKQIARLISETAPPEPAPAEQFIDAMLYRKMVDDEIKEMEKHEDRALALMYRLRAEPPAVRQGCPRCGGEDGYHKTSCAWLGGPHNIKYVERGRTWNED